MSFVTLFIIFYREDVVDDQQRHVKFPTGFDPSTNQDQRESTALTAKLAVADEVSL